jgi:hypothetical protein
MPWPPPISLQFRRWSSDASINRGNHTSGAASSRPSAKITTRRSSRTLASTAVASYLTAEVGIPCLHELQSMLDHEQSQTIQFMNAETTRFCKMRRLRSFQTVEEEAKAISPQYRRHPATLLLLTSESNAAYEPSFWMAHNRNAHRASTSTSPSTPVMTLKSR